MRRFSIRHQSGPLEFVLYGMQSLARDLKTDVIKVSREKKQSVLHTVESDNIIKKAKELEIELIPDWYKALRKDEDRIE